MKPYVLDASAAIAFLREEAGSVVVKELLKQKVNFQYTIYLHKATLAEIYYDALKVSGFDGAEESLHIITALPISVIGDISDELLRQIGYFKTHYKISFADCFVLATAKIHNATVVTSDHHEFDAVEKNGDVSFEWIR